MAAVSMQGCSPNPARELTLSTQSGGNQALADRVKAEEGTGELYHICAIGARVVTLGSDICCQISYNKLRAG